ncbi:hypothetical protein M8494_12850 [Serratia ureilytica]
MLSIKNLKVSVEGNEILKGLIWRSNRAKCTPSWGRTARARARCPPRWPGVKSMK